LWLASIAKALASSVRLGFTRLGQARGYACCWQGQRAAQERLVETAHFGDRRPDRLTAYAEFQPRRSLAGHISIRVAVVALVMSVVQLLVVIGTHRIDYDDLALDHVRRETEWLSRGIKPVPGGLTFELPGNMGHYGGGYQDGYAYRILDRSGQIIAFQNASILEGVNCPGFLGGWLV